MVDNSKDFWKLKLLSGVNAEKEIVLPVGNNKLGNTEFCDFIIDSPVSSETNHQPYWFNVEVSSTGITLTDTLSISESRFNGAIKNKAISVDQISAGFALPKKTAITIDGLSFAIGQSKDNLNNVKVLPQKKETDQRSSIKKSWVGGVVCCFLLILTIVLAVIYSRSSPLQNNQFNSVTDLIHAFQKNKNL